MQLVSVSQHQFSILKAGAQNYSRDVSQLTLPKIGGKSLFFIQRFMNEQILVFYVTFLPIENYER
jgi:hypothetical protein